MNGNTVGILVLCLGFTGFVFLDTRYTFGEQQRQIDGIVDANEMQAIRGCTSLPTPEERETCMDIIERARKARDDRNGGRQ